VEENFSTNGTGKIFGLLTEKAYATTVQFSCNTNAKTYAKSMQLLCNFMQQPCNTHQQFPIFKNNQNNIDTITKME
jgi:hypothetical protein